MFYSWIFCAFLFFSCSSGDNIVADTFDLPLTYLALGDSYTIGESVSEDERYPIQLITKLNEEQLAVNTPKIIARTGWTTDELQAAIAEENITDTFDIVSLLIGVNNQYRGYPVAQFEKEYRELLDQAIGFAGGNPKHVFVLSIPDYGVTPFAQNRNPEKIGKEIDEYNAIKKSITEEMGVTYFDITPISRLAKEDLDLVAEDGLHPSGKMYDEWSKLVVPHILALFPKE